MDKEISEIKQLINSTDKDSGEMVIYKLDLLNRKYSNHVNQMLERWQTSEESLVKKVQTLEGRDAESGIKERPLSYDKEDQEFILWAKEQKIQVFKRGDLEVHFSPMAFVETETYSEPEIPDHEIDPSTDVNDVDDDLLYHSSN